MIDIVKTKSKRWIPKSYNPLKDKTRKAPPIHEAVLITYTVHGVEMVAKVDSGVFRLPLQSLTLREFMKANGIERMTSAIMKTLVRSSSIDYEADKEDTLEVESFRLLQLKYPAESFLGNYPVSGPDSSFNTDRYLDGFLSIQTGTGVYLEEGRDIDLESEVKSDLRATLLLVYYNLKKGRKLETFQDAVDLLGFAKKETSNNEDAEELLTRMKSGHDAWKAISPEEIYRFIKDQDATKVAKIYFEDIVRLKEQS